MASLITSSLFVLGFSNETRAFRSTPRLLMFALWHHLFFLQDVSSHDATRFLSDRERKAHHERELLLQQDRRIAER